MAEEFTFELYVYKKKNQFKEILEVPFGRKIELPLFGVTTAYLRAWESHKKPHFEAEANEILIAFADQFEARKDIQDVGEPPVSDNPDDQLKSKLVKHWADNFKHFEKPVRFASVNDNDIALSFWTEFEAVNEALTNWLVPSGKGQTGRKNRKSPTQRYAEVFEELPSPTELNRFLSILDWYLKNNQIIEDDLVKNRLYIPLHESRKQRNTQFSSELVAVTTERRLVRCEKDDTDPDPDNARIINKTIKEVKTTAELFTSQNGLIPLVWAEILFAVRNDIFARRCLFCGDLFDLPKSAGGANKKYCRPAHTRLAEKQREKEDKDYPAKKRLQMQRSRSKTQEEKDKLTAEILKLKQGGVN